MTIQQLPFHPPRQATPLRVDAERSARVEARVQAALTVSAGQPSREERDDLLTRVEARLRKAGI